VLDLACGSGDVSLLLQKALPTVEIIGLDFSPPLLAQAKARGVKQTIEGDALQLPFPQNHFSAVTLAFGLRNFADRARGLNQIHQVLSPNGIFALLEFSPPPLPWKLFWDFYLFHLMPWVAQQVAQQGSSFRYLAKSISEFPTPPALNQELQACGLKILSTRSMSLGLVRLTIAQKC